MGSGITTSFRGMAGRVQAGRIAIGAFESPFVTTSKEVVAGKLELAPNPATNVFYVKLPIGPIQPVSIKLFDSQGRQVGQQVISLGQPIDVSGLASGVYSVQGVAGQQLFIGKFSKASQ